MTGHQQNPTTGLTLKSEPAPAISIEKICEAAGVRSVRVVDPHDMALMERTLREELAKAEPSVIVSRRACALLKSVRPRPPVRIDRAKCRGCAACMKLGCPAIRFEDKKAVVDEAQCVGCSLCVQTCAFKAIGEVEA